jgi:hypothetical protein
MKNLFQSIFTLSILTFTVSFFACKENSVSDPQASGDCGASQQFSYAPYINDYTNTFIGTNNVRTFQFSGVTSAGITNVCTKSKPTFYWEADFKADTTRELTFRGVSRWSVFGTNTPGSITTSGNLMSWRANETVGLQQAFGDGPGNFHDVRIDISFQSLGTLAADKDYLISRFSGSTSYYLKMRLDYEQYVAP